MTMLESVYGWKLTATLPVSRSSKRQFDLFINQINFLQYDFLPKALETSKTLKGIIKFNENLFLENEEFEWNLVTAQNRIRETLAEDGQIFTLEMKNIDCSDGVLQELM